MTLIYILFIFFLATVATRISAGANDDRSSDSVTDTVNPVTLLWSDRSNILENIRNPSDLFSAIHSNADDIESIVIFTVPADDGSGSDSAVTLESMAASTTTSSSGSGSGSDMSETADQPTTYYTFFKEYLRNGNSRAAVNIGIDELHSHLSARHSTYILTCDSPTSLDTLNPYTFAYNKKIDILVINIVNGNLAQQCVTKVMSKVGSKYIAAVTARPNVDTYRVADIEGHNEREMELADASADLSSSSSHGNRRLLQTSSFSQYSGKPAINPQYPWSSAQQSDIPLRNRQGPLYITPSILYGLMISGFLLSVLYIGIRTLADIERPVRFATQILQISKEY